MKAGRIILGFALSVAATGSAIEQAQTLEEGKVDDDKNRVPKAVPIDNNERKYSPPPPPKIRPPKALDDGNTIVNNEETGRAIAVSSQKNDGNEEEMVRTQEVLDGSMQYLKDAVLAKEYFKEVYKECRNDHELCSFWASDDECKNNFDWMVRDKHCLLACKRCDTLLLPSDEREQKEDLDFGSEL